MSRFARFAFSLIVLSSLASGVSAQGTTGIPGFNDYTVGGLVPGSSSCNFLPPFAAGSTVPFSVSTAPFTPVTFLFTLSPNCLCVPCFFPFPNQGGCPNPANPSCTTTNQSLDIALGCGIVSATVTSDSLGVATISVVMPPPGFGFGTQAVALHPCAGPPFPFLLTQAYALRTI